jgi:putative hemolysin
MQLNQSVATAIGRQRALPSAWPDAVTGGQIAPSFRVEWARTLEEIREAQRLRFEVFVGEMGAVLQVPERSPPDHDIDALDGFCDHLLVRADSGPHEGQVVATCRVLTPTGARRAGHRYTDLEFDLAPIRDLLPQALEMGRVCVHRDWRNGLLVMALWRELGRRMSHERLETLIGCCSVSLEGDGHAARHLWHGLKHDHLAPPHRRVTARHALPLSPLDPGAPGEPVPVPTLFKGYLRCGGRLLGPPAIDRLFHTADFPMMMSLADLPLRYRKRIFGAPS